MNPTVTPRSSASSAECWLNQGYTWCINESKVFFYHSWMLTSLHDPNMLTISGLYMTCLDGQSIDEAFGCFMLTSVASVVGPSVTTFSTDFSIQSLVFWNLFEFSAADITLKSISLTFWIQILPNKFH